VDRNEMSLESQLQAVLLLVAPKRFPTLRLFRRNVGAAKMHGVTVRFAIPGQCDLYGITRNGGHLEVELKAAGKRLSPDQRAWAAWCAEWEVPHIVLIAEKEETVEQTVERWCRELGLLMA
jgi:hypothetical protein